MVGIGSLILVIGAAPSPSAMAKILRELRVKDSTKNRKWIRRRLRALHEQHYVEISNEQYSLSELGVRLIEEERLRRLRVETPKVWNKEWHLVAFDIPKQKSHVRIQFVRLLQNLGFVFYQRSVWIHPYDGVDEVRKIALHFDILPFVSFIVATHVDGSHAFRRHFRLPAR
jgi:DNA-binding transcriptional regulator PaaX